MSDSKKNKFDALTTPAPRPAKPTAGYHLVRADKAGVFVGRIVRRDDDHGIIELEDSRRIWYWSGACTISDLALHGVTRPPECRFPPAIPKGHIIRDYSETIPMTEEAMASIHGVVDWTAHEQQ